MISGAARLAGVMGWPIDHSRSPALHGFWLAEHGIDGAYVPLAVHPDHLDRALRALPALGFRGCNLTIPHKEAALRSLDRVEPVAQRIGAVNTVTVAEDGTLEGRNSDVYGFRENLKESAPGWDPAAAPAVVLGAGGSARAVVAALLEDGAPEIRLVNRSRGRAEALARDLSPSLTRIAIVDWADAGKAFAEAGLLVNTTSLGMAGQPGLQLDLAPLPTTAVVTDLVYVPLETELLTIAGRRGNPVVDGLGMLLHQGRPGFEAWFGVEVRVSAPQRAAVLATFATAR